MGPRDIALEAVLATWRGGRAQAVLQELFDQNDLSARDRALATDLAFGTIRSRLTLDAVIDSFARQPRLIPPTVRAVLQVAIFQLVFLDRIPASAAVNTAVELARRRGARKLVPFVNGLLRQVGRNIENKGAARPSDPERSIWRPDSTWVIFARPVLPSPSNLPGFLSALYSHPKWLVRRWLDRFGAGTTEQLCRADNTPPATTVLVNLRRANAQNIITDLQSEGVEAEPNEEGDGLLITRGDVLKTRTFRAGLVQPQDFAAMIPCRLLGAQDGELVADVCCAPGGKTLFIRCKAEVRLISFDRTADKLVRVRENLERFRFSDVSLAACDVSVAMPVRPACFDRVLIDVPCSNSAVLARRPEARWRISPDSIVALAKIQKRILCNALPIVRKGGLVVYSTCSLEREENEGVVQAAVARGLAECLEKRLTLPQSGFGGGFAAVLRPNA